MALKDSFKLSICASNSIMGKESTKNTKKKKKSWPGKEFGDKNFLEKDL